MGHVYTCYFVNEYWNYCEIHISHIYHTFKCDYSLMADFDEDILMNWTHFIGKNIKAHS